MITLIMITLFSLVFYASMQQPTVRVANTLQFNQQSWMVFVPNQAEYVDYVNYQQAAVVSGNVSLFGSDAILRVPQLNISISPYDVMYEVDIELASPQLNGTISVLSLPQRQLDAISTALRNLNTSTIRGPLSYDDFSIYVLLIQRFGESKMILGYLSLADDGLILSYDQATGLQNVETILDQISSNGSSLFDNVTMRNALLMTDPSQTCLAFFVGRFPSEFAESNLIAKSVTYQDSSVVVTRAFLFPNQDLAADGLTEAEQLYSNGSCTTAGPWLMITQTCSINRLPTELSGI
jgi:hypothetical protein